MKSQQTGSWTKINIGRPSYQTKNKTYMMILETSLFLSNMLMILCIWKSCKIHMVIYCILFLFNQSLISFQSILEIEDPLHISQTQKLMRYVGILIQGNMVYLLIRIISEPKSISSFLIGLHYIVNYYLAGQFKNNSKKITEIGLQKLCKAKFINPLILYIFGTTSQGSIPHLSLIYFFFFTFNSFLASEIVRIVNFSQTYVFGWSKQQNPAFSTNYLFGWTNQNKINSKTWNKKEAIKGILISSCAGLLIQNIILMFNIVQLQISVAIIHSLIIGILALVLYNNPPKI